MKALSERLLSDFAAEDGGFYFTAHQHEVLLLRTKEGHDGALPSANAVAARLLVRLAQHLDRSALRERGVRALEAFGAQIARAPEAFATSLSVFDRLAEPPFEVVAM